MRAASAADTTLGKVPLLGVISVITFAWLLKVALFEPEAPQPSALLWSS
jgi:hypothetical protein